ncbi:hypothetical protein B296_00000365 [Ensete ventricosum]|uniref:Uncharacterized protein n=1 Tax=Ensete ventricosum TaxID=4639 RepID=A0A427BBS1_ENSVE|nr:hypothetical protein B296_00000365 [Ensete ventricosum]
MAVASGRIRFGLSRAGTLGGFPREPLESVAAEEDLHKGLIGMGLPDVTPLTFKLVPDLFFFGDVGILTRREVARTLSLTSVVTPGVAKSYGESVDAKAWRDGMAPHAAFGLARRPDASTSDVDVAVEH